MKYLEKKEEIYNVAVGLLKVDIQPSKEFGYMIVHHPFTSSPVAFGKDFKNYDLTSIEEKREWEDFLANEILKGMDFFQICRMICKPYRMTFLKYCMPYLDYEDIANFLKSEWVNIEFPNYDSAFSTRQLVSMFKKCKKELIMDKDELEVYNNLPEEVTVYRGVSNVKKQNKHALSWTLNKEIAEKFSVRFKNDEDENAVFERRVPKSKILCYFAYEEECILDTY